MHEPVLAGPAVAWLDVRADGCYVDCTAGAGGHAEGDPAGVAGGDGPERREVGVAFEADVDGVAGDDDRGVRGGVCVLLAAQWLQREPVRERGLVFMDTPGFDPVSATGQVAGGANVMCFTTGRGSAYGNKPCPSIKIATNSSLYERQFEDMDINCGDILDGVSIQDKGREIFEMMLRVASGQPTKSEELGYGDNEYVPWHVGAMM